jgi:hypothetical protein
MALGEHGLMPSWPSPAQASPSKIADSNGHAMSRSHDIPACSRDGSLADLVPVVLTPKAQVAIRTKSHGRR